MPASDRQLRSPLHSLSVVASAMLVACLATTGASADAPEPAAPVAGVVQQVTFADGQSQRTVTGRVVIEDEDGGVLLEAPDGRQWVIEAADVVSRQALAADFEPLSAEQLAEQVLAELPDGFQSHITTHYVVCFNTTRTYAEWTSSLLERLHRAFTNYWTNKGVDIHEPEFPLVVIVYATADQYRAASADELGSAAGSVIGYYSLTTNRISMFDLTGAQAMGGLTGSRGSRREINQMLTQPAAVPLVATVVHEATHQIAFNCGLQHRLAELPLWLVEGMAVYFEAPDLSSSRGWRGIGKVNYPRLSRFKSHLRQPGHATLLSMLADDKQFRDPRTAVDAYADAWALNYFLIRYYPNQYVAYVRELSTQLPLVPRTAEQRIQDFRDHFGDPATLEREFLQRMQRIN